MGGSGGVSNEEENSPELVEVFAIELLKSGWAARQILCYWTIYTKTFWRLDDM